MKNGLPTDVPNLCLQDGQALLDPQAIRLEVQDHPHHLLALMASVKSVQASSMKALVAMVRIANSNMSSRRIRADHHLRDEVLLPTVLVVQTTRHRSTLDRMTVIVAVVVVALQVPLPEVTTIEAITILPIIAADQAVNMVAPTKTVIVGGADPLAAETRIDYGHMGIDLQIG